MSKLSVIEFKNSLSDVLNRVEFHGERAVIQRRGKDTAVICSIEEIQLLDRLKQEEEDRIDIAISRAARERNDYVSYDDIRRELGLADV